MGETRPRFYQARLMISPKGDQKSRACIVAALSTPMGNKIVHMLNNCIVLYCIYLDIHYQQQNEDIRMNRIESINHRKRTVRKNDKAGIA